MYQVSFTEVPAMTQTPVSKFLICFFCVGIMGPHHSQAATKPVGDLRKQATTELSLPVKKAQTPAAPVETPYLQSALPAELRDPGRPRWTLEVGLENQKPQGEISVSSLGDLQLDTFASRPALVATLGWWFSENLRSTVGTKWKSGLAAQIGWSQHRYSLDLPGRSSASAARLEVLRPQLALMLEYLVASAPTWNTEFWLGVEGAGGRLLQSQTSPQSDLLNVSLNKSYWELGSGLRAVFASNFLVNLQYRQRRYTRQKGASQHAVVAVGIAL
jgi:hypothetical protein